MTGYSRFIRHEPVFVPAVCKEAELMRRPCSANEVLQIARKSCIGSGLAVDRAEDLAEATVLLQCSGHDGLVHLLGLLKGHETASEQLSDAVQIDLVLKGISHTKDQLKVNYLRPHIEGVAVIDWLLANPQIGSAVFEKTDDWVMLIGLLVCAVKRFGGVFILQAQQEAATVTMVDASVLIDGLPEATAGMLSYQAGRVEIPTALCHHTDTDLSVWEALEARAHLTYVSATEISRQRGAGAGLVDND